MDPLVLTKPISWWTAGFKWRIHEGHGLMQGERVVRVPPGGLLWPDDQGPVARPRNYQPLHAPELLHEFASLGDDVLQHRRLVPVDSPAPDLLDRIVSFADKYGPPWLINWPRSRLKGLPPTVEQIRVEARTLRVCVQITDGRPQVPEIKGVAARNETEALAWVVAQCAERLVDVSLVPMFRLTRPDQVRAGYVFTSLLGAIWLQYLASLVGERERVCAWRQCGAIISQGRPDKRFCNDQCRDAEKKARKRDRKAIARPS